MSAMGRFLPPTVPGGRLRTLSMRVDLDQWNFLERL